MIWNLCGLMPAKWGAKNNFKKSIRKLLQLQEDGAIIALLKEVRIFEKFLNTERGESTRSANRTAKKIIPIVSCNCVFERYSRGICEGYRKQRSWQYESHEKRKSRKQSNELEMPRW